MTLHDLFISELKTLSSAERQLVKALPKMIKAATSAELKAALSNHLQETENHVIRIENAFESVDAKAAAVLCEGMKGLLDESAGRSRQSSHAILQDLALIGAAERIEHYEIAAYAIMISMAKIMGYAAAANLLVQNSQEEHKAAELLLKLARPMLEEGALLSIVQRSPANPLPRSL